MEQHTTPNRLYVYQTQIRGIRQIEMQMIVSIKCYFEASRFRIVTNFKITSDNVNFTAAMKKSLFLCLFIFYLHAKFFSPK